MHFSLNKSEELSNQQVAKLHDVVVGALKQVYDPEIPVDIFLK